MEKKKYYILDTETTDIQSKDIVQLAILKEDGSSLNMFFNPIQEVSYIAMSIHHLNSGILGKLSDI